MYVRSDLIVIEVADYFEVFVRPTARIFSTSVGLLYHVVKYSTHVGLHRKYSVSTIRIFLCCSCSVAIECLYQDAETQ